ncbi:alpha/beta hydrolase [Sporichthya sp.]|uniref:alpha/beta hydrolase n=1 Tax=Sporichthya sp. TaxID=65475 RepID=UPI001849DE63|nr:alpha/beta hydrolase [Sporichthya sp.]MBA3745058.1 alpha/beta hydrolase [Sporichthya sp.]
MTSIDPVVAGLLEQLSAAPDFADMPVADARGFVQAFIQMEGEAEEVASITDVNIPGPDGNEIAARIYTPHTEGSRPVILYFHGGGYALCTLEIADKPCRELANLTGCVVVNVEYRLAPEDRAPAQLTDCYAVTQWAVGNISEFGGDGSRLAVSGDSAGGALAAGVALMARDQGGPAIDLQILIYPITDVQDSTFPSRTENGSGYLLTQRSMDYFADLYLTPDQDPKDPYVFPARATDLSNLPDAVVITAGFDPLRDEGTQYAEKLAAAGSKVTHLHNASMIHGFMWMGGVVAQQKVAVGQLADAVKEKWSL